VYASDDIFDVKWIATTLPDATDREFSINAFRLAAFLSATHKLMLIDRRKAGVLCSSTGHPADYYLMLKMGSCKERETSNISKKNREGLFIEIYNKKGVEVVLGGDVSYNSMWRPLFKSKELRFMHVPHHCSKMKLDRLISATWPCDSKHAVISAGRDETGTTYDHYSPHKKELDIKFGKNVHYTSGDLSRNPDELRAVRLCKDGSVKERI
jgi:hypothetical protein